jgi:hypothetical protein
MIEQGRELKYDNVLSLRKKILQNEINKEIQKFGLYLKDNLLKKAGPVVTATFSAEVVNGQQVFDMEIIIPVDMLIRIRREVLCKVWKMSKLIIRSIIVLNMLVVICLIFLKENLLGNVSALKVIFLSLGIMSIILFIPDMVEIKHKLKNFRNILLVIEQKRISRYLMLSLVSFMSAFFCFYQKNMYSFSLCLMLIAMSLFFLSRHKAKYYLSNTGMFWAGSIIAWKDVSSLEFNEKTSMIVILFRTSPHGLTKSFEIPYNKLNEKEIRSFLNITEISKLVIANCATEV